MSVESLKEQRPKSFSKFGKRLEHQMHPEPVKPTKANPVQFVKRERVPCKPSFETIPRDVKSPFTLFHAVEMQNLDYKYKHNIVDPNQPKIFISNTKTVFFTDKFASNTLREFSVDKNDDPILMYQDKQKSRKKLHNMDFFKQPQKKLGPSAQKGMVDAEQRFNNFNPDTMKRRSDSVHSFRSYTKRKDLYEATNSAYRSKDVGNVHQIDMNRIRRAWSSNKFVPFDKLVDQVKVRTDRDCRPWFTQLNYNPKDSDHQTTSRFECQSARKPNEVHSRYPMRHCV